MPNYIVLPTPNKIGYLRVRCNTDFFFEKCLVHAGLVDGRGGVAGRGQRPHEAKSDARAVRITRRETSPLHDSTGEIRGGFAPLGEDPHGISEATRQSSALRLEPALNSGALAM